MVQWGLDSSLVELLSISLEVSGSIPVLGFVQLERQLHTLFLWISSPILVLIKELFQVISKVKYLLGTLTTGLNPRPQL